jgi:hypothetical protein
MPERSLARPSFLSWLVATPSSRLRVQWAGVTCSPAHLEAQGFAIVPSLVPASSTRDLLALLSDLPLAPSVRRRREVYAARDLLSAVPAVGRIATAPPFAALVRPILGASAFLARALLFDKTPSANWKVTWHQDLTITLREPSQAPGFGPCSIKAGIAHTHAPDWLLSGMLTIRLHLDECPASNGPLRIIAGSHAHGRLTPAQIDQLVAAGNERICPVPAGGALIMRPLLLHASSPSQSPDHRRVLHLEFAAADLPPPLAWLHRMPLPAPTQ